jgi:two-component system CheB/CheR fusion protein
MNVHQISKISDYIRYLQKNPNELDILFNELLIGVTNFFRDPEVWEKMKKTILPDLIRTLPKNYTLRAWIAGCSTGEEAYSLAIIFKEVCETINNDQNVSLQIFASDIDSNAIEKARTGFFNYNISADVSPGRIKKYFKKEGSGFRINTTIREMIVFAPHDIIKDPPFTKLDLLFCRNLLIYLELELQKKLMRLFHYSLKEDGVMLLGNAESENAPKGMFTHIDQKLKFYKRTSINTNMNLLDFPSSNTDTKKNKRSNIILNKTIDTLQVLTDQIVLQRFAPASVLINSDGDILYITGRTGKYIEPSAGRANWNIYAMAREGLKYELPSAIRKVKQNYDPIKLHNLKVETNGKSQYVDVTIQQIEKPETIKGMIIIVFSDVVELPKAISNKTKSSNKDISSPEKELAFKLQHANEELHNTREEMQIAQEELKSANEELQTINEELQSTNEELTSSKEEMQSLNEELQTVNAELQSKVNDFTVANNDLKNLLNSTDIATLFLDNDLNICRFTEQLTKLFKLRPGDIGRPFTDMVSNLDYPDMSNDAKEVLRTLVYKETPVATDDNRWFKVRIMPYRTIDDRIEGLVVTFIEMTELKSKEDQLNQAIALLRKHDLYKP